MRISDKNLPERDRLGRALRTPIALAILLMITLAATPVVAASAALSRLYLDSGGTPASGLTPNTPSGNVGNYDPDRNSDPGLTIQKGGSGTNETDPTKYQIWMTGSGDLELNGDVSLTFWSASEGFDATKRGMIKTYLLDCAPSGTDCDILGSDVTSAKPWSPSGDWVARTIDFGSVAHSITADRRLAVEIVVSDSSGGDVWFAYDAAAYPSHLAIELATIPSTTTTTTTTPPPTTSTTTTTTTRPPTTTTTTTTTTVPDTTTTTTLPHSTTTTSTTTTTTSTTTSTTLPATTTSDPSTTTTTTASPGDEPPTSTTVPPDDLTRSDVDAEPAEPIYDVAMRALPTVTETDTPSRPGLSAGLLEGLEVVIPPVVANVVLSPLILIEALVGAFVATGRDLVIPGIVLAVLALWIARDTNRRRDKPTGAVPS